MLGEGSMSAQLRQHLASSAEMDGDSALVNRDQLLSAWQYANSEVSSRRGTVNSHAMDSIPASIGNVQSFLESVTPSVRLHTVQAPELSFGDDCDQSVVPYFSLRDFWTALEQWSCYGVGVPLLLDSGEQVVQYYTPYLSGMQLFTRQDFDDSERLGQGAESSRNDSDISDAEFRDSSSDSSDTSDRLQARLFECNAALTSASHTSVVSKKDCPDGTSSASSETDDTGSPTERRVPPLRETSSSPDLPWSTCVDCKGGELCFQYFEKERPHMRLPICDLIRELERSHPVINSLRSFDLHPSSWISIAWYPVYMIPSSLSLKDMTASFLTFHGLSTQRPSPGDSCSRCREEFWAAPRIVAEPTPGDWEEMSSPHTAVPSGLDAHETGRASFRSALPPFGMCGYKTKGGAWSDIRSFDHLRDAAEAWVKQMGVNHPDFAFFSGSSYL